MKDDYDYDWSYPAKTGDKASPATKKAYVDPVSKAEPVRKDKSASGTVEKKRNPDRNLTEEREKDTSVAVASLVFGIISILSSWLIAGIGFGVAGIVLAVIVIKNSYYGKGYATGGLVTSIAGLLTGIILPIVIITSLKGAIRSFSTELVNNLANSMMEYAGEYIPAYIEENGQEYIRQYIEEAGQNYIDEFIDNFGK